MERQVIFEPGYDKREEGYGIHSMYVRFLLKGKLGVVQFVFSTGFFPPSAQDYMDAKTIENILFAKERYYSIEEGRRSAMWLRRPMGVNVGYHSYTPRYEGQTKRSHCEYLNGPCYYDGSGLAAEEVLRKLIVEGDEAVWKYLEDYYKHLFESS